MPDSPCLFLSHSGADTEAARALKKRLLETPAARAAGLTVWFDKDDLAAGTSWQEQLEVAITRRATAFAVLVGSKGVINWVEREVRLGLARATGEGAIPFVPILAEKRPGLVGALPPFAQQHQGVTDPLGDPAQLAKLMAAILGGPDRGPQRLTDEPFVGLRAMTERESDRFFGRRAEVDELVDDLRRNRLIAIVADSGAGKSSLAMAGLAPAFRGGALAAPSRGGPDDAIWHVVVMRPGGDPTEGLRDGLTEAAQGMGLSGEVCANLRKRLTLEDISEAAHALRCDLPKKSTETLLIVDQFDELLTETPEEDREPFIDFLLNLAKLPTPGGFHVVLTVRVDYFNLCRPHKALYDALQAGQRVVRLKRITDDGLEEAVRTPLRMAGFSDEGDQHALVAEMRRDLGDRPGDLALAQMALWTVWRNRAAHDGSLLKAYLDVGGVSGALAQEAERIRLDKLTDAESALLPALLVRLVRLGETGGVLRRIAGKEELDDARGALADKLASDEYGRLLLVGEGARADSAKVEVCHEALITQWPWLQNTLNAAAADLRVLERLMDRAGTWGGAAEAVRERHLATGAERELFAELGGRRDAWLSETERGFIAASEAAFAREEAGKRRQVKRLRALVFGLAIAALALGAVVAFAVRQTHIAEEETRIAKKETARAEKETARAEERTRFAKVQTELAESQTRIAEQQKARADKDFNAAREAIDQLLLHIVEGLQNTSGVSVATMRQVLETVRTTIDSLVAIEPNNRPLQHSRWNMLLDFSDVYLRAGDIADARKTAADSLIASRQLAADKSEGGSRNLAASLERVGDADMQAGDRVSARAAYEEERAIFNDILKHKPDPLVRRYLANTLERIGDVDTQTGDSVGARAAYEEGLAIFRDLAKDGDDLEAQRSLAIELERIGDADMLAKDRVRARAAFAEELAKFRELAKNTSDRAAQRSLGVALEKIGNVDMEEGDRPGARSAYTEELKIFRDLASDKDDAQAQRFLAVALDKTGNFDQEVGDSAGSRAAFLEEQMVIETLDRQGRLSPADKSWWPDYIRRKLPRPDDPLRSPPATDRESSRAIPPR